MFIQLCSVCNKELGRTEDHPGKTIYSHGRCRLHELEAYERYCVGHLKINGTWYATKYKWADIILQLVRVDEVMKLSGSMDFPKPVYIKNFTEIFSLLKKSGVTEEEKNFRFVWALTKSGNVSLRAIDFTPERAELHRLCAVNEGAVRCYVEQSWANHLYAGVFDVFSRTATARYDAKRISKRR